MATRALGARRVSDSLRVLGASIKQARAAAGAMSAGQIIAVQPQDIPKIRLPQIKGVAWEKSRTATLELPAGANEQILVAGDRLKDVAEFTLVGPSVISFDLTNNRGEQQFVAVLDHPNPAPGRYAAKVTNDRGRTATLLDACVIKPAPENEPAALELGELIPNVSSDDSKFPAALIVTKGEPREFYFTDPWNNIVKGMTARRLERAELQKDHQFWLAKVEQFLEQVHSGSDVIFLQISIASMTELPAMEDPDGIGKVRKADRLLGFQFVARSSGSEDRLTFTVMASK